MFFIKKMILFNYEGKNNKIKEEEMEEYKMEFVKERRESIFSIVNQIFHFGSFLKGDKEEVSDKEDKQKRLKDYIKNYDQVKKSKNKKEKILQYFCDALNKIVPDNKKYEIEEMEKIFSKIEIIYSLNIFQYQDHLKFMIAFPLFDSYISRIDNFSTKWENIISPFDLELKSSSTKIRGSSKSFFTNNQEKLDEVLLVTDLKTIENWKKEKNLISTDSIYKNMCKYKETYKEFSPEIKALFSILYLKTIIWGIYYNKESVKEFIRIFFEAIYLSSSNKISDEEKEKLFIKFLIDEVPNVKDEEKESLLNYYINISKLIKNLEKVIENSKIDFEKIFINSIKRIKLNNENIYIFNEEYNILKKNYNLEKHKEFIDKIEKSIQLKNYYEYSYYLYLLIDSYNLLNIEKEKYKNQELRDSTRFLKQLEKKWKGKLNNKIIEGEYKKTFNGKIRAIAEIFNIILEIFPNSNLMIEIIIKRIFTNEKLVNKFLKYLEENFNINLIK